MNIRDREITTTCDLLDLVRERPAMWIGLRRCPSFEDEQPHFYDFHAWIAAGLNRPVAAGWRSNLLDECGSDRAAFERFWIELDAFRGR